MDKTEPLPMKCLDQPDDPDCRQLKQVIVPRSTLFTSAARKWPTAAPIATQEPTRDDCYGNMLDGRFCSSEQPTISEEPTVASMPKTELPVASLKSAPRGSKMAPTRAPTQAPRDKYVSAGTVEKHRGESPTTNTEGGRYVFRPTTLTIFSDHGAKITHHPTPPTSIPQRGDGNTTLIPTASPKLQFAAPAVITRKPKATPQPSILPSTQKEDFESAGSADSWTGGSLSKREDGSQFLGLLGQGNSEIYQEFEIPLSANEEDPKEANSVTVQFSLYLLDKWTPPDKVFVVVNGISVDLGELESTSTGSRSGEAGHYLGEHPPKAWHQHHEE
eukprot:Sro119_g058050.2  (331) ;mRNA; r:46759-47935